MGVNYTINTRDLTPEQTAEKVQELLGGAPEITFECTGQETCLQTAVYVSTGTLKISGDNDPWKDESRTMNQSLNQLLSRRRNQEEPSWLLAWDLSSARCRSWKPSLRRSESKAFSVTLTGEDSIAIIVGHIRCEETEPQEKAVPRRPGSDGIELQRFNPNLPF